MTATESQAPLSPRTVPKALLTRYATNGPRYTSYPTAPQFSTEFDEAAVRAAWSATNASGKGLSLYVHVPFCARRCLYCGCTTEIGHSGADADCYIAAVLIEAARVGEMLDTARPVEQLALGGGTPTFLSPTQMTRLVKGLSERFAFAADGERSIEIDPRSVDTAYLDALLGLGFNRMSFGLQDLDPTVQRNVGRVQDEAHLRGLLGHLHDRGFRAVNLDLMYGLPGQSPESFERTIEGVVELAPSRIALFGYAHVPWVSPHQKALERHAMPGPAERMELFGLGYELLRAAGYAHVGMDHFALPGDELIRALESRTLTRNFMGYTTRRGLDLVALGASSISSVGTTYTQNVKTVAEYLGRAAKGTWARAFVMSAEDRLRREIIMTLFCNFHMDTAPIEQRFGLTFKDHFASELARLAPMEADGLLHVTPTALSVTDLGRFFIRNLCMVFDQYLGDPAVRYSKTI